MIRDKQKSIDEIKFTLMQLLDKLRKQQTLNIGTSSKLGLSSNP